MKTYSLTFYWNNGDNPDDYGKWQARYASEEEREKAIAESLWELIDREYCVGEMLDPEIAGVKQSEAFKPVVSSWEAGNVEGFIPSAISWLWDNRMRVEVYRGTPQKLDLTANLREDLRLLFSMGCSVGEAKQLLHKAVDDLTAGCSDQGGRAS